MEVLEAVEQHGAIAFREHIGADLHDEVRADADDVLVEGGVVELAERETIPNGRLTQRVGVRDDVGGV